MAPAVYAESSIPSAMSAINQMLLPELHHHQDNLNIGHNVTIDDQVLVRITRKDREHDDSYSPTPEGIHQDNTEISSVTLVNRSVLIISGQL